MKSIIHISLLILLTIPAISQQQEYNALLTNSATSDIDILPAAKTYQTFDKIDQLVINLDDEKFSTYQELAQFLSGSYKDELSKVRSIYTWIALNIVYDRQASVSPALKSSQIPSDVWQSKMAVCEGYSNLFNAMCKVAGIESRIVKGYVRDFSGGDIKFPNHAWNSVRINGKWQLLDVTWANSQIGTGHLASKKLEELYSKHKLDYFFMIPPQKLILTHLPEDPLWQLQNNLIDFDTFLSGEFEVEESLKTQSTKNINFEKQILNYEKLDSLDRSIAYLERMVTNSKTKVKEYGLGIAYYYKAQEILKNADIKDIYTYQKIKDSAREYYEKSLKQLSQLRENDFGFDFSQDFVANVSFRMEVLQ